MRISGKNGVARSLSCAARRVYPSWLPWLIVTAAVLLAISALGEEKKPLLTFVLAGQSNMLGKRVQIGQVPAEYKKPDPRALFFDAKSKKWIPIEAGKTEPKGMGPEVSFGINMARILNAPIGIIKHSKGGTSLAKDWAPETKKSLYKSMLAEVRSAQKTRSLEIAGMVWIQGGADSKNEGTAKAYSKNLTALIERARKDFGNAGMVFLSGRIPPKKHFRKKHWPLVRAAQQDLSAPLYGWIDCDDVTKGPDKVHYDAKGMVNLGIRAANQMAGLLGKPSPEDKKEKEDK